MTTLIVIVVFGVLVIVHEFGHFLAARRVGVRVEKFAIGFGPAIFKKKIKETMFLVCAFPLGGYVKLAGEERAQCKGASDEYFSKSVGERIQVVFAGPLFNYLLAFFLFWFFAFLSFPSSAPVVGEVIEGYPAEAAGVRAEDKIISVNDREVNNWQEMAAIIHDSHGGVELLIERAGKIVLVQSSVKVQEVPDDLGRPRKAAHIGVLPQEIKYRPLASFGQGLKSLWSHTSRFFKGIAAIILGIVPFKKAAMGPIGIYFLTSEVAKVGILAILKLVAILSLSLGLINLFPIPVLDGGHILLFTIEKIRNKCVSAKTEGVLNRIGVAILATLMVFVFYQDIKRGRNFSGEENSTSAVDEASGEE
jgi:regulator of sigma E protease